MLTVGELLVVHVLIVQIALSLPGSTLGRLQVYPTLNRFGLKIGVTIGVYLPHPENVIERMWLALW